MPSTTDKNDKPRDGYKQIPNALIDNPNLCIRDKMVLIKLASHAYGKKRSAYPSQVKVAKCLGIQRETVKAALDSLTALGIVRPHGKGRQGKQETFTIDLDRAANLTAHPTGNLTAHPTTPDGSSDINKTEQIRQEKENANPEVTSEIRGDAEPQGHEEIGSALLYTEHAGLAAMFSAQADLLAGLTPEQIRDCRIAPDGTSAFDVCADADAWLLAKSVVEEYAEGEPFNPGELDKLCDEYGNEAVWFHAKWFPRRIGALKSQPNKPTAYFIDCVRKDHPVNPTWPKVWMEASSDEILTAIFGEESEESKPVVYLDSIPF